MLLIGSRHRRDSCSEAYRFARSGRVPVDPKIDLDVSGLLSWGSSIAPPSTQPSCVVTRLGRRPDFGSGLPRPDRVPLLPFLPASAVCYAASRSEDPLVRRSAGLLHPAADHGVRHVSDSLTGLAAEPPTRRSWTRRSIQESSPVARTLRSVPLLGSRRPCRHRASSFRTRSRSPAGVPSRRWSALACVSPRRAALLSTSGLSSTEESVAFVRRCRLATARCSLGLWIDSFRRCRAYRAAQLSLDVSPGGPNRFGVPSPEREGKAGCFGPVWLHATEVGLSPKGRPCSIAVAPAGLPKESPRPHPRRATKGMPVDPPRRRSTASVRTPEGIRFPTSSRRISEETRSRPSARSEERRPVVRAPSLRPSAVARVHDGETARRGHHARRREHLRATRAHPAKGCCVEPVSRIPKDSSESEPEAPPGGGPLAARDSDNLQQAGGAGSGPDSRRVHRDGRDSIRRRSLSPDPKIGMTGAEAPWVRSVRTSHLWWRSVASTEVPAPRWTVIHPRQPRPESALLPFRGSPKRSRSPDRCDPDGR
jgi:hypothetical protein